MDRRKILIEKENTIYETLNSDDLNLELAQNIEHIFELKEIIKYKANQTFIESTDNTKIKRIDAIKKSCIENLNNLKLSNPNRRVALVVFNDTVKYYGDGSHSNEIFTIKIISY